MSDLKSSGSAPILARDLRVWVEELERLQRSEEQDGSGEYAASRERISHLASRLKQHWRPGVGSGVAGVELVRPLTTGDFFATWQGSRPPAAAPILVTLLEPDSITRGHLLCRFLDGMEAAEHLTRYGGPSEHVARVQAVDESMLAWTSEFPDKGTLGDSITRGMPVRHKLHVLQQACKGLSHAHAQGIVHGGLRLESVGLRGDGTVFVHEFGLLRLAGDRLRPDEDPRGPFMAPEVVAGARPDPRSDVYSFGRLALAVLFDLDPRSNLSHRMDSVDLGALPPDLGPVLHRATSVDPVLRQSTAQELLRELQTGQVAMPLLPHVASGELVRPTPRWRQPVPLLAITVGLLVAFGVFVVPHWFVPEAQNVRTRTTPTPTPERTPRARVEATPTPARLTSSDLEEGLSRYLPADTENPYADLGDEALSARLLFLDQAEQLRGRIQERVAALFPGETDPAMLALMAWTLERRSLDAETVSAIRERLGQQRQVASLGEQSVEFARLPGEDEVWMATREVTQALWASFREDTPAFFLGPDQPVESLSWCDALAFTNAVNERLALSPAYTGVEECTSSGGRSVAPVADALGARLPTGAEWDLAAAAGVDARSWMGGDGVGLARVGWLGDRALNKTHPVGQLAENPWGLADVHGNVAEWIWEDAPAPGSEVRWVSVRGGSWRSRPRDARVGERTPKRPEATESDVGFRLLWAGPLPTAPGDDDSAAEPTPEE